MAKVSKSVREKRKDFAKTKLKVGKGKQLPANHTETSFRSKAIVVPKQSLTQDVVFKEAQLFNHRLALLSHKNGDTRKEAVQALNLYLTSHPPQLSTTITPLVKAVAPMIIDDTSSVRKMLLELYNTVLAKLPGTSLNSHVELFLLYISSAMTHISPSIRADSTKFLDWAMNYTSATETVVQSQLDKFMSTFATLFNWTGQSSAISSTKVLSSHLNCFRDLLTAALTVKAEPIPEVTKYDVPLALGEECFVKHRLTDELLKPGLSLNLFSIQVTMSDGDSSAYDVVEPHIVHIVKYMADRFIDSSNGDRALCLPILQIFQTLCTCERAKSRKEMKAALTKVSRAMLVIQETAGRGLSQVLLDEWNTTAMQNMLS